MNADSKAADLQAQIIKPASPEQLNHFQLFDKQLCAKDDIIAERDREIERLRKALATKGPDPLEFEEVVRKRDFYHSEADRLNGAYTRVKKREAKTKEELEMKVAMLEQPL